MVVAAQGQGLPLKCLLTSPLSSLHCWGFVIIHHFIRLAVLPMLMFHQFKVAIDLFVCSWVLL